MKSLPITTFTSVKIKSIDKKPDVQATNDGIFCVARMTTAQREALNLNITEYNVAPTLPENGTIVYDTTTDNFMFMQAGSWQESAATPDAITFNDPTLAANIVAGQVAMFNANNTLTVGSVFIGKNIAVITANGNWAVPANITSVKVTLIGAGGGTVASNTTDGGFASSGGGGGATMYIYLNGLITGTQLAIILGSGSMGTNGTASTLNYTQGVITGSYSAAGGKSGKGLGGDSFVRGGTGGGVYASTNNTLTIPGQMGGDALIVNATIGSELYICGNGGCSSLFNPTSYSASNKATPVVAYSLGYGSGASGGINSDADDSHGAGAPGICIIEY